jgi:hypothetical protein
MIETAQTRDDYWVVKRDGKYHGVIRKLAGGTYLALSNGAEVGEAESLEDATHLFQRLP